MRATVSGRKGTEPTISVGRRRVIFSMELFRQQSPIAGKPRTEQTSAHHGVTATRWRLAPSAQRIEVQDGASETMRNAVDCFEMRPEAIIQENSKDGTAQAGGRRERLLDVTMKNFNQVFGGARFAGIYFGGLAEDVVADFAVNDFDQQAVHSATAGRDLLQHRGAVTVLF